MQPPNLATALPYNVVQVSDKCRCDQDCCLVKRYGGRYTLAVFEVEGQYAVTWWLSKN